MSEPAGKIYKAIPLIMSKVGHIAKTRTNQQGATYKFRGIDDVYLALQPLLFEHGVFFVPNVIHAAREERQSKAGGNLIYTVLRVQYTFFADDGSSFECVVPGEAMDSSDKSSNKAMSAALKYALLQIFCIPTEEEKDTEYQTPESAPKIPPAPAQTKLMPGAPCELCGTYLHLSKSGQGYFCPKFKDTTQGEHTRFKVDQLEDYKKHLQTEAMKKLTPAADQWIPPTS